MKFFDATTRATIRDEINRITGVDDAVYKLVNKLARVDAALDEYWALATMGAPKLALDDTGQSSYPLETQNIVSGTNYYQISDFTNAVLQILRLSVLNADAIESQLSFEPFDDIDRFIEDYDPAVTGTPDYWTKMGDFIYLRPTPNYSKASGLRCYPNRELSKYTPVTFTTTNASNQIDATAHGLSDGDTVILLTNNTLPDGYSEDTVYYVRDKATDSFKVATAGGGTAVTIADDGTGTHKFIELSKTPGIPVIHHKYLARKAALEFMDQSHPKFAKLLKQIGSANPRDPYYGGDELAIVEYWANQNREPKTIIRTKQRCFK